MYSQKFLEAVERVLASEGGLVDDPDDPGGLTNYGISAVAYPEVDVRNLTREGAIELYWRDYWQNFELINDGRLARQLLDMAVSAGRTTAIKLLQEAANMFSWPSLLVDGKMGAKTLAKVNKGHADALVSAYRYKRVSYYLQLAERRPSSRKFLAGWFGRVERA